MIRLPLLTLLALAACTPTARNESEAVPDGVAAPPAAAAAEAAYLVRGEPRANWTPGWAAVMLGERLLLDSPTSAGWYAIPLPAPRLAEGRRTYAGERLTLTVEPGACAIREYYPALPDRISLEWDSGRFEGCGGPRTAPAQIAGTTWELMRIGDARAPAGRSPAATLIFGLNGGLGGTLACNDGGIRSTWTGDGGFAHRGAGFEQTAMGCNDPAAEDFGGRFWSALTSARGWRREGDRLLITFADGTEAELRLLL